MNGCEADDRNAGSTGSPRAEQTPSLLQPVGLEIGLQQSELDQVVLRAAAANAFAFTGERGEGIDRRRKIPAFKCREAT